MKFGKLLPARVLPSVCKTPLPKYGTFKPSNSIRAAGFGLARKTFALKIDEFLLREREKNKLGFDKIQEQILKEISEAHRSHAPRENQNEAKIRREYLGCQPTKRKVI